MRIVHTLLRYPPASGGVEEYTRELTERLRARGDTVRVETTNLKTHHPPTLLPAPTDDPPYVHRHTAHTFDAIGYPIPHGLREALSTVEADILHAHGFWYAPADIAARVCKRRGIPFVLNPYYANTENRRTMKWQLYRILYGRATVAAADAVVVISPFEQGQLKKDRFLLQRVECIPPGIDPTEFRDIPLNPYPSWGLAGKTPLLFAGRIAHSKGLDLLLKALPDIRRTVPDVHLVIIGEDFGFRRACEVLAARLGVTDTVTWLGKATRAELRAAYRHARLFVFPSRYEAFGIVLLEAAASGCPAVATRDTAIPYVVQDEKTGLLFEPENIHDLTEKVLTVLLNHDLRTSLAHNAQDRAQREFSWERSVEKFHRLYAELVRQKQGDGRK